MQLLCENTYWRWCDYLSLQCWLEQQFTAERDKRINHSTTSSHSNSFQYPFMLSDTYPFLPWHRSDGDDLNSYQTCVSHGEQIGCTWPIQCVCINLICEHSNSPILLDIGWESLSGKKNDQEKFHKYFFICKSTLQNQLHIMSTFEELNMWAVSMSVTVSYKTLKQLHVAWQCSCQNVFEMVFWQ